MAEWALLLKPSVRRVLDAMLGGATTLTEIAAVTGLTKSALVPHLKAMGELGLVHGERVATPTGSEARYRLRDVSLHLSIDAARSTATSWATVGPWTPESPLTAQIPQPAVRSEVDRLLLELRKAGVLGRGETLVLLGSVARGEATWKSDIDVLVLRDTRDAAWEDAYLRAQFEVEMGAQHRFSTTFITRDDWTAGRKRLVQEARDEGIVIWTTRGEEAPWSTMKRYAAIRI